MSTWMKEETMPIDNLTCKTCIHRTKSDGIVRCQKGDIEIQNERNIYVPCKDWKPECYGKEYIDYETGSIKIYGEEQKKMSKILSSITVTVEPLTTITEATQAIAELSSRWGIKVSAKFNGATLTLDVGGTAEALENSYYELCDNKH